MEMGNDMTKQVIFDLTTRRVVGYSDPGFELPVPKGKAAVLVPDDTPIDVDAHAVSEDGTVFEAGPVVAPPATPAAVTMRQARLALHRAGVLDQVSAAIDALPEPARTEARIEWDYSQEVRRTHGLVDALAPGLGLSGADIDALFVAAGAL